MSVIVKLLSKFDDSGIKKAKHEFGGLKKTLGAIGLGIGLKQVADLFMDSAKAASADAKSIKLMNLQLARNANATKGTLKQNNKFIESLSLQTGILDDDLRPSLSKFANVTHNVGKAQKLLKVQLDVVAGSGKSSTKVANALAKAYAGNTKSLIGMFPELKNSKDALGDLTKEFSGAALVNADPFMKFNNSMDILKEKLGNLVLPMIADLVTELTKPGGVVETVGKFLEDMANPKTDPGKMFKDIKNAVADTFQGVKDFFALFGNGDAMKGFGNVASTLVKMLPALIALKGLMMLASAGTAIANLAKAVGLIQAGNAVSGGGGALTKFTKNGMLSVAVRYAVPLAVTISALELIDQGFSDPKQREKLSDAGKNIVAPKLPKNSVNGIFVDKNGYNSSGDFVGLPGMEMIGGGKFTNIFGAKTPKQMFTPNIIINNYAADPKAVVDALGKYVKTNGALPKTITNPNGR
jgi:hypothetical protein